MTDGVKVKFPCFPTLKSVEAEMLIAEQVVEDVYGEIQY